MGAKPAWRVAERYARTTGRRYGLGAGGTDLASVPSAFLVGGGRFLVACLAGAAGSAVVGLGLAAETTMVLGCQKSMATWQRRREDA